jgi:hypothetical protein
VLVFRFYFSNGVVKWLSRDPAWRDGSALKAHYMTQPLPGPLSWFAYHLPMGVHKVSTYATLIMECVLPFCVFIPVLLAETAWVFIAFQVLILLTGNFASFNWAGIALALLWIPDSFWGGTVGYYTSPFWGSVVLAVVAMAGIFVNLLHMVGLFTKLPRPLARCAEWCVRVCICNPYGAFAVMTTERFEWILEASLDEQTWESISFKWKPGDIYRWPRQVAPFMPRVDWHMWFAALESKQLPFWVTNMIKRFADPDAVAMRGLFERVPFDGKPIPYIRVAYYRYQFTDWKTWRATGAVWERERLFTAMLPKSSQTV